jgi:hypothetical protein
LATAADRRSVRGRPPRNTVASGAAEVLADQDQETEPGLRRDHLGRDDGDEGVAHADPHAGQHVGDHARHDHPAEALPSGRAEALRDPGGKPPYNMAFQVEQMDNGKRSAANQDSSADFGLEVDC